MKGQAEHTGAHGWAPFSGPGVATAGHRAHLHPTRMLSLSATDLNGGREMTALLHPVAEMAKRVLPPTKQPAPIGLLQGAGAGYVSTCHTEAVHRGSS